tara:strand:- start:117 stop:1259 length:1143 start_codon:yes stop_codon:yes gene_type:complete
MLKNKIYRYFFKEIGKTFITILFAFTAVAWTVRAVNFLDLIVDNGHSLRTYLFYSLLNITNIITKFIPLSFFITLMISITKFERQNELVILWTNGLNKIKLVNVFMFFSILVFLIQFAFSTFITPSTLNKSRTLIRTSDFESISSIIKINDFTDSFKNLTFFVEKKSDEDIMENIFIRDEANIFNSLTTDKNNKDTTIIAKKGYLENKKLLLTDGVIQTKNNKGEINNLYFKKTELFLNALSPRTITTPKLQETSTYSLGKCFFESKNILHTNNCNNSLISSEIIETLARRVGMPFYIPLVSLICCFLLISKKNKSDDNTINKNIYFILGFLVLVLGELLVRFSGLSTINFSIYFLIPLLLIPVTYIILIKRFKYEKVFK